MQTYPYVHVLLKDNDAAPFSSGWISQEAGSKQDSVIAGTLEVKPLRAKTGLWHVSGSLR